MSRWVLLLHRLAVEEDGPTSVEYAVMLALILVTVIGVVATIGQRVSSAFDGLATQF